MPRTNITHKTKQFAFRVPHDIMARIDKYKFSTEKRTGLRLSQAQVVVLLIELGLMQIETKGASR